MPPSSRIYTIWSNKSQLLSPVGMDDVPIIRCLGLNYMDHAKEANMPIPDVPVLFIKPRTAVNGPHPAKINIPKFVQDGTSDYESELSFVLSKSGRDIPESEAMDYVLGFTCSNDVSARAQQFKNSQWSFSKGELQTVAPDRTPDISNTNKSQDLTARARLVLCWSHHPLLETRTISASRVSTTGPSCRIQTLGKLPLDKYRPRCGDVQSNHVAGK